MSKIPRATLISVIISCSCIINNWHKQYILNKKNRTNINKYRNTEITQMCCLTTFHLSNRFPFIRRVSMTLFLNAPRSISKDWSPLSRTITAATLSPDWDSAVPVLWPCKVNLKGHTCHTSAKMELGNRTCQHFFHSYVHRSIDNDITSISPNELDFNSLGP